MRKVLTLSVVLCLALSCVVTAWAIPIDEVQRRAMNGDIEAQCTLGACYYMGRHVKKNIPEGLKWLRRSADGGYTEAQALLGDFYHNGAEGVRRNYAEAAKYLIPAANSGDANSQFLLGTQYYNGWGVKRNLPQAFKLFLNAGSQGIPEAQNNLGVMYYHGYGVRKNTAEAFKWWKASAKNGNKLAAQNLKEAQDFQREQRAANELLALGVLAEMFSGGYSAPQPQTWGGSSERGEECYHCFKIGDCRKCKGTGKVTKVNYNYDPDTDPDSWMTYEDTCPDCEGTGKCQYCGGTGIIR